MCQLNKLILMYNLQVLLCFERYFTLKCSLFHNILLFAELVDKEKLENCSFVECFSTPNGFAN